MSEQPQPPDRAPEHRQGLVARLDRLARRWLPPDFDGRPLEEQRRLRTLLGMCAIGAPAAGVLSLYALATTGLQTFLVIGVLTCMLASVPLLIRWTGSAALPAHMGLCAFCLCSAAAMWLNGGVNSFMAG